MMRTWRCSLLRTVALAALLAGLMSSQTGAPAIAITLAPPRDVGGPDKMAPIEGIVTGECVECRVVLYAKSDAWYVQPWADAPLTEIGKDGKWNNDTHLGTEYAALLVRVGYKPQVRVLVLPKVGDDVVAVITVPGRADSPTRDDEAIAVGAACSLRVTGL